MMGPEEWRPVAGHAGLYEVSNFGHVRSLSRVDNLGRLRHGRVIKPQQGSNGYQYVKLCRAGESKRRLVHRIVAEAFLRAPLPGEEIDHVDGNKSENAAHNLEWVTSSENKRRALARGVFAVGERSGNSKLKTADVRRIRELRGEGFSQRQLASQFGVSRPAIVSVLRGETWRHVV